MSARRLCVVSFLIGLLVCPRCGPGDPAASTRELVLTFHERILTVDPAWDPEISHRTGKSDGSPVDLPRMKDGGLDAAFFIAPVPQGEPVSGGDDRARKAALAAIDAVIDMVRTHPDQVCLGLAPQDAYRAEKLGLRTVFIGLGNGGGLGRDLSLLETFHTRGVRLLTLCGDTDNDICDSAADARNPQDRGLSDFGRRVVEECNRLGIVIDLAGASEKSFFDVLAASTSPVVVSRAGTRALSDHTGNLTDEMLRAIAEKCGAVHICLDPRFLVRTPSAAGLRPTLDDFMDHIDHVRKVTGTDHVGISAGFDGGGGVEGCRDASELVNLTVALLRRGYREADVERIWGGNFMRVFERATRLAERK